MSTIKILGLAQTSGVICVPKTLSINGIEEIINQIIPLADNFIWSVDPERQFADGYQNPCPCNAIWEHGENRLHYIITNNIVHPIDKMLGGICVECSTEN